MPEAAWTDDKVMPWGKHKGVKLGELPAGYLLWLYEQPWIASWVGLYLYLKEHEDQLLDEKADANEDDDRGFQSYDDYKSYRS